MRLVALGLFILIALSAPAEGLAQEEDEEEPTVKEWRIPWSKVDSLRMGRALDAIERPDVSDREALEELRALDAIERPHVSDREALVEGRVVDADGEGIRDYRVYLVGAAGNPLESFGSTKTLENGYFALVAERDDLAGEEGTHRVRLVVESPDGDTVHEYPAPLSLDEPIVRINVGTVSVSGQ